MTDEVVMNFALLDTVVLTRDLPEHGLRVGDLGAVVDIPANDTLVIDFVGPSGGSRALGTLTGRGRPPVKDSDILSVRVG